jgi:uracil-DNA glycosylase family 4
MKQQNGSPDHVLRERDERLREMGLTPVWRARVPAPAPENQKIVKGSQPIASATAAAADAPPKTPEPPQTATPIANMVPASTHRVEESVEIKVDNAKELRDQRIACLEWDPLIADIAACVACTLSRTRRNTVPGVGSTTAGWMFVGEAPGAEEDAQGEPFVGQAGRLLDNMFKAIGLDRARDVYIANVLKCRPPGNRNPEPGEVAQCAPFLERQLAIIRPRVIVALGRFAAMTLLNTDATVGSLRGRVHQYCGVPLIVTYHPAYLLRNLPDKAKAWEDLLFARKTFAGLQSAAASQT